MKEYIKRTIDSMRQELLEFLPQRIIDVIEPKDVLRMHQYKIGNEIIKEQYRIKSTQEYIELMNWYDAQSRIVLK